MDPIVQFCVHLLDSVPFQLVSEMESSLSIVCSLSCSWLWMEDIISDLLVYVSKGMAIFRLWTFLYSLSVPSVHNRLVLLLPSF